MQLFATFVKIECNFFNFLMQQKLALLIRFEMEYRPKLTYRTQKNTIVLRLLFVEACCSVPPSSW